MRKVDPGAEYRARLRQREQSAAALRRDEARFSWVRLALFVAAAALTWVSLRHGMLLLSAVFAALTRHSYVKVLAHAANVQIDTALGTFILPRERQ